MTAETTTGAALLRVDGLSVRYGKRLAVDNVCLSLRAGEIVGMLGPNGAGKSTSLLAMAGALKPTAGRVEICGVDSEKMPLEARAKVGLADQPPSMYEFLTVAEHVGFVAESRGTPPGDPGTHKLLEDLGLSSVLGQLVRELSFGYRQRVGLAAALAGDTQVVLIDETLNGLDPRAARATREVLSRVAKSGAAILMSTHLLGVAERLCTRLIVMDRGRIVRDLGAGELTSLLDQGPGALEQLYLSLVADDSEDNQRA